MNYEYWLYQQLEPGDILIMGKQKREPSKLKQVWDSFKKAGKVRPVVNDERKEDEYLKSKNIIT